MVTSTPREPSLALPPTTRSPSSLREAVDGNASATPASPRRPSAAPAGHRVAGDLGRSWQPSAGVPPSQPRAAGLPHRAGGRQDFPGGKLKEIQDSITAARDPPGRRRPALHGRLDEQNTLIAQMPDVIVAKINGTYVKTADLPVEVGKPTSPARTTPGSPC